MNQNIKARLLEIFNEELENIMQEVEPIDTTQISLPIEDYSTLSISLSDTASKLKPETIIENNKLIKKILETGRTSIGYSLYSVHPMVFIYLTDALATIVKREMPGAENAKKALMTIFGPYSQESSTKKDKSGESSLTQQKMSSFFVKVNRFAANHIDLKGKDAIYFINDMNTDNLLDAFYKGFENAIRAFNPDIKKSFNSLISTAIANAKIDIWRKQNQYIDKGVKQTKYTSSLDNPLDNDDLDSGTLGDTIPSPDLSTDRSLEKNRAKKIWGAIDAFIKRAINFSFPNKPEYEQMYDMYTNHGMDMEEIANTLGLTKNNLFQMKMKAEDAVKDFIEDGTMAQFVSQTTGESIRNIPFVKGKGSEKMRFVFPRIKDELNENVIVLSENGFDFNTTSFYKESEYLDLTELANLLAEEAKHKLTAINNIYNQFEKINKTLNEGYDGNYNVDVMDLFEQMKQFVEESQRIISALYEEVYKMENAAYSIHNEYPLVAAEIDKVTKPIIQNLEEWPNKLSFMLKLVRQKYNPNNAFGVS